MVVFFFQAEDGIRDLTVTGVQTCALPISEHQADTSEARADTLLAIVYPKDLSGNTIPTSGYAMWNAEYAQHVPTPSAPYGFGIPYDNRFIPPNIYTTYATYNDPNSGLAFKPQSGLDKTAYSGSFDWKLAGKTTLTAIFAYTDMRGQLSSDADASPMNLQVTDRKSTRLNSSHSQISYAVFCLKKKTTTVRHSHDK